MDETNPKDTTANPAAGPNTAQGASGAAPIDSADVERAAATISEQIVPPARKISAPPAPPIPPISARDAPPQPTPAAPPAPVPRPPIQPQPIPIPPILPVQPPPPAQTAPAAGIAPAPSAVEKPAPQTTAGQSSKPLREDIARIIDKIKLPERIAVKISGEKAKPPAPPPPAPPTEVKAPAENEKRPEASAAQAPGQTTEAKKESGSSIVSVHTLKDDLQNVVRDKKMSLVRAVALESEKKKGQEHLTAEGVALNTPRARKMMGIAFAVVVFLALAFAAYFGARTVFQQNAGNPQQSAAPALIFTEKTFSFPQETLTGTELKRAIISRARNAAAIQLGAIIQIIPTSRAVGADGAGTEQAMSIGDFLASIETRSSPELLRALRDDFFLGLHQIVGKLSPVLIIPVNSYERAFAGMLAWEPAMNGDLSPIFTAVSPQTTNERGVLADRQFQDELINNYDVRVLRDDSGAVQMLYSFPTRTMLIISESPYSFTEALSRLRASRQL